jgi:hypothetical protein
MNNPAPITDVFRDQCVTHAILVKNGAEDLREAVDHLQDVAIGYGLVAELGQDWVQQTIAEAFDGTIVPADKTEKDIIDGWDRAEREAERKRGEREKNKHPFLITIRTAAELRCKVFDAIKYIVTGYIVEGCTIVAGRPKIGKSWLLLDIGLAVARGETCLGNIECQQGDVLYLALEDNERRLQNRITRLKGNKEWPESFHYATEWPRADDGGVDEIRKWIETAEKPRLVVVDVLAMFRSPRRKDQQPYEADYAAIQALQAIASQTGVAIVIVHHLRKSAGEVDPFEKVSGTLGLSGAADTVLILDRDGQGTTLYGRGRDIEEIETAVQFSKKTCRWQVMGEATEVRRTDERTAIIDALKEAGEPMSAVEISDAIGVARNNVKQLLFKMAKAGEVTKVKRGRYHHPEMVIGQPEMVIGNRSDNQSDNQEADLFDGEKGRLSVVIATPDNHDNQFQKDIISQDVSGNEMVIAPVIATVITPPEPITNLAVNGQMVTAVIEVIGGDNQADNHDNQRPPKPNPLTPPKIARLFWRNGSGVDGHECELIGEVISETEHFFMVRRGEGRFRSGQVDRRGKHHFHFEPCPLCPDWKRESDPVEPTQANARQSDTEFTEARALEFLKRRAHTRRVCRDHGWPTGEEEGSVVDSGNGPERPVTQLSDWQKAQCEKVWAQLSLDEQNLLAVWRKDQGLGEKE